MNRRTAFKNSVMAGLATLLGFRSRRLNPEWLAEKQSLFINGNLRTLICTDENGFVKNPPKGREVRIKFVNTRYIPTDKPGIFRVKFDEVEIPKYI